MHKSCVNAEEHIVRGLLENGGDPNAVNNNNESVMDKCCITCYYGGDCMKKCNLVQGILITSFLLFLLFYYFYFSILGDTPRDDICQDNPVTALVLGDIYDTQELKTRNKKCCSNCHSKSCALSCDIIGNKISMYLHDR